MEKLRIVFMGTPDFAVGILDTIVHHKYNVVGVITAPDKPAGRGQKINTSAVKDYALKKGLKILQPTNLKDEAFLSELKSLDANCQVVVAFRMLPEVVWKMPKLGTFNLHASLLPNYRGAAPINWAIINGESKTGVTTFFIDDKIDTGAIILSAETPIEPTENVGQLHDRLMVLGSKTVIETLTAIENGTVQTTLQTDSPQIKTANKLNRDNCKIDWTKSGKEIFNLIRGLSPYPVAYTLIQDEEQEWNVKIYEASFEKETHSIAIGTIISTKKEMKIAVSDGFIQLVAIQFPGKKKMTIQELLNGMKFSSSAKAL
ncbi:methionyl-tRNA formyltransferase [Flavobacterium lacus]|uniref:Methionyl-tRNA formyltransferase n=1 Tax=Flavobacterium lacus TaxID=1353778 RepID=A0A328WXV5_9FLAO|nr:methionyl-tRNA formyltransferase [Flavobacterium lacus]RAR51053.1 methionyl-tRNA formyltransferase [Flavobacterium lacus]